MESGKEGKEGELVTECVRGRLLCRIFTSLPCMLTHTHTSPPTPPPTHSFTSCVTHLLRNFTGATPFTPDSSGFTPLHYAALYGHKMAVQMASHCKAATHDSYKIVNTPMFLLCVAIGLCPWRQPGYCCLRHQNHTPPPRSTPLIPKFMRSCTCRDISMTDYSVLILALFCVQAYNGHFGVLEELLYKYQAYLDCKDEKGRKYF